MKKKNKKIYLSPGKLQNRTYEVRLLNDDIIMILQLCRTGHDDVSRIRMKTLTFIVSDLFPVMVWMQVHVFSIP